MAAIAAVLVDPGREREAVSASLLALARYLPRYSQSLARYAHGSVQANPETSARADRSLVEPRSCRR